MAVSALPQEAMSLLLELLEMAEPCLSGFAYRMAGAAAEALVAAKLLRPSGHEHVVLEDSGSDGLPAALLEGDEHEGWRVFDENAGLRSVPDEAIMRHRLELDAVLDAFVAGLPRPLGPPREDVVAGGLFRLGLFRLPGRSTLCELWLARRLHLQEVRQPVSEALSARPTMGDRLLLTSTPRDRFIQGWNVGSPLVSLHDVLSPTDSLALDPAILTALLDGGGPRADPNLPIIRADGREVQYRGQTYKFPRGETQRRIILHLYKKAQGGVMEITEASVIAALDLGAHVRLKDIFKDNKAWGQLLDSRDGIVGFCRPGQVRPAKSPRRKR
jgi:hypothetical protein